MREDRADGSTLRPDNSFNNGGSSEMARRDIILSLVFNTKILQWRISVISKNSDKLYVPSIYLYLDGREEGGKWRKGADGRFHPILISGPTLLPIPINSVVYLVKELSPNKYWYKMLLGTTTSRLVTHTRRNRASSQT